MVKFIVKEMLGSENIKNEEYKVEIQYENSVIKSEWDYEMFNRILSDEVIKEGHKFTLSELNSFRTISVGHTDNVKILTDKFKLCLSRCTVADGEEYDNKVTVETLVNGEWKVFQEYQAKDDTKDVKNELPPVVGAYSITNTMSINVHEIEFGIDDKVVYSFSNENKTRKSKIRETAKGRSYFMACKMRVYLDEVCRV